MNAVTSMQRPPPLDEAKFLAQLREDGVLTDAQLTRAEEASRETRTGLIQAILQLGFVLEDTLYQHLADKLQINLVKPADIDTDLALTIDLPVDFLERVALIPVRQKGTHWSWPPAPSLARKSSRRSPLP